MAEAPQLEWFRERLNESARLEPRDPQPVLNWRNALLKELNFSAHLIGLDEARSWERDDKGNIIHLSGQFFSVEAVRVSSAALREVPGWDQPIYNQPDGGVLALIARDSPVSGVQFLLQAKAQPGNIGWLQLSPSIQCTWSNLRRAHEGHKPALAELLLGQEGVHLIYRAQHNEEGGCFWRKSNDNRIILVTEEHLI